MDKIFTASYAGQLNKNFKVSNLMEYRIGGKQYAAYCVITNILQRGCPAIPTDSIEELVNEDKKKGDAIMRLQIAILCLLMNGTLSMDLEKWTIAVKTVGTEKYEETAIDNLMEWIQNIFVLMDLDFNKPAIDVMTVEDFDDVGYDAVKIFMNLEEHEMPFINEFGVVYVMNMYEQDVDYFAMCMSDPVAYNFYKNIEAKDKALRFLIKNIFGFEDFWPGQDRIIKNALARRDTIGVLPTGSGKSMCYQLSALLQPCLSICISPIKSLMIDQCQNLYDYGIEKAAYISSDLTTKEREEIMARFYEGKFVITYMAPERFQSEVFRRLLNSMVADNKLTYGYIIIDEVHCMSEWGHNFRTSYLNLVKTARRFFPEATLLGLTATASENVLRNIKIEFGMKSDEDVISIPSFTRKELEFSVINVGSGSNKFNETNKILERYMYYHNDMLDSRDDDAMCGIIFTPYASEKNPHGCAKVAKALSNKYDADIRCYAGERPREWSGEGEWETYKLEAQKDFKDNKYNLIVATKAFGTGIDKKNIRYTIHYGIPSSLEALYQEAGRAGRDKRNAQCIVLHKKEPEEFRKLLNKALAPNSSIAELKDAVKTIGYKGEDLSRQAFLFANNLITYKDEMKCAVYILRKIKAGERELQAEKKFSREMIEKVVYHLSVIGVIEDWTVDWNKDSIKVYLVNGYTFESVCQSANRYISNYGTDYKITPENEFIVRNAEKFKDIKEILVLGLFYNWYKEKIISYRKQSLINVVETCERFEKEGPDVFKNTIESYFRLSDITSLVSQIADNPNHYEDWFQVFSQAKTDQISMKEISISMGRFLESFNNNVAIDFLSGIANMLADTFESMNGRRRLKQAMEVINEYEPSDRIYILNETMKLVADQKNPMLNETFSEFFIQEMNVDGIETMIYNALKDNYSLKTVLEVSMKKIADYVR